jgi:D-erythro-7,8-dihydroneopterin triphosphate epimerase
VILKIKNLKARTFIGIYDWERRNRQEISVSFSIEVKDTKALTSDNIEDALNYETVSNQIRLFIEENQFDLIEKLANDVLGIILEHPLAEKARVEIIKPGAVKNSEYVSVTIDQTKEEYLSAR